MMVLAHWLRIRSCIKIIHVSCTTQSEVQLGKRFSKFFLVPVKYKRLCTSRKGVYNSLVEIEQEVIFQWVKLLEISSVFCSCCLRSSPAVTFVGTISGRVLPFTFFKWPSASSITPTWIFTSSTTFSFLAFIFLALSSSWNDNLEFEFDFCALVLGGVVTVSLIKLWY